MAHNAISIQASLRNEFGKGAARRARREGRIPAVIYGHGIDPIHITFNLLEFQAIVRNHGVNAVVNIDVEGENHLALIKAVDQNVLTFNIDHADLLAIKRGEKVEVDVPLVHVGDSAPGTIVMQNAETITISAEVMSIPEEITVSVDGLADGTQITAADIALPEGAELLYEPETLVFHVITPTQEAEEETAETQEEAE